MKKILTLIIAIAATVLAVSSCQKGDTSGKVQYSLGFPESNLSGETASDITEAYTNISTAYMSSLATISGASVSGSTVTFDNVNYDETDSKVVAACKSAESKVSFSAGGYVKVSVTSLYFNGGGSKTVYTKTFGTK